MNPFVVLDLPEDASVESVTQRWRELARIHHPDAGGDEKKFCMLREAYLVAREIAETPVCRVCGGSGVIKRGGGFAFVSLACPSCGGDSGCRK